MWLLKVQSMGSTLMSFQSKKLHNFKALLSTIGVTSLITCSTSSALEAVVQEINFKQGNATITAIPLPALSVCTLSTT